MPKRSRRVEALIRADLEKGERSENRVEEALQHLVSLGKIHHYYRAELDGELDRQGIDFLVFPEPDWIIPLQVKSSDRGREKHIVECASKIPCVVTGLSPFLPELCEVVLQELGLSVKFLEEIIEQTAQEMEYERFNAFPALV